MSDLTSEQERDWLAWAIAKVVLADKIIAKEEEEEVQELLRKNCSLQTSMEISMALKKKKKIEIETLELDDRELASRMLKYLTKVAIVDESIVENEIVSLIDLGEKLGFKAAAINQTIDWRKNYHLNQKELDKSEDDITQMLQKEPAVYS
ncbi:MAG: hypothetical protein HQM13_21500 [SAR324 cluster bacterium]|nr:hypothetical protein [SAR324 cluster bacterium]